MVSRESPDTPVSVHPSSVRNEMPVDFMGPRVSRARGWKVCELRRDKYFNDFLAAACSATPRYYYLLSIFDAARLARMASGLQEWSEKYGHAER